MCLGDYKEASGLYEIRDASIEVVRCMVDYMYTGSYDITTEEPTQDDDAISVALGIHVVVFSLAHFYSVLGLQDLSAKKYNETLRLKDGVLHLYDSLPAVFENTPDEVRDLREIAVDFARARLPEALKDPSVKKVHDEASLHVPSFIIALAESLLITPLQGKCSTCSTLSVPTIRRRIRT